MKILQLIAFISTLEIGAFQENDYSILIMMQGSKSTLDSGFNMSRALVSEIIRKIPNFGFYENELSLAVYNNDVYASITLGECPNTEICANAVSKIAFLSGSTKLLPPLDFSLNQALLSYNSFPEKGIAAIFIGNGLDYYPTSDWLATQKMLLNMTSTGQMQCVAVPGDDGYMTMDKNMLATVCGLGQNLYQIYDLNNKIHVTQLACEILSNYFPPNGGANCGGGTTPTSTPATSTGVTITKMTTKPTRTMTSTVSRESTTSSQSPMCGCLDLIFVIDKSHLFDANNSVTLDQIQNFINNWLFDGKSFKIGHHNVRVALVTFDCTVNSEESFDFADNQKDIQSNINSWSIANYHCYCKDNNWTNPAVGFRQANDYIMNREEDRPNAIFWFAQGEESWRYKYPVDAANDMDNVYNVTWVSAAIPSNYYFSNYFYFELENMPGNFIKINSMSDLEKSLPEIMYWLDCDPNNCASSHEYN